MFNPVHLRKPLEEDRELRGLDWNMGEQLDLLKEFQFNDELIASPLTQEGFPPARTLFMPGEN